MDDRPCDPGLLGRSQQVKWMKWCPIGHFTRVPLRQQPFSLSQGEERVR